MREACRRAVRETIQLALTRRNHDLVDATVPAAFLESLAAELEDK
jgi:hypothetical protein